MLRKQKKIGIRKGQKAVFFCWKQISNGCQFINFCWLYYQNIFWATKKNRKTYWFLWLSSVGLPIYICQHNCSLTDFIELILLWIFQNKRWKKVKKKTRLCKLTLRGGKMKKKKEEINIVFVRQKKKSSSFQYLGSMQLRISSSLTVVHPIIHDFLLFF